MVVVSGPSRGERQLLSGLVVVLWVCLLMYRLLPEMKLVVFIATHMHLDIHHTWETCDGSGVWTLS